MLSRPGFRLSLRDFMILITMAALVTPLVVQYISRSRGLARKVVCQENLRVLGVALYQRASTAPSMQFCTGASDFQLDGCVDTFGWVADMQGKGLGQSMVDPANPLAGSIALEQMLSLDPTAIGFLTPLPQMQSGICMKDSWREVSGSAQGKFFSSTTKGTFQRAELLSRYFVGGGMNTNYAASWILARGNVRSQYSDQPFGDSMQSLVTEANHQHFYGIGSTTGPLSLSTVERSRIPAALIPFMGCAAPDRGKHATLSRDITHDESGHWASVDDSPAVTILAGSRLAATLTHGPAYWDPSIGSIQLIASGETLEPQLLGEKNMPTTEKLPPPTGPDGTQSYLQDTRAWYAVHNGELNLLMGDGSVKTFADLNGDQFLNPGFEVGTLPNGSVKVESMSYQPGKRELEPAEFYGGVFINDFYFKGHFGG